MAFKAEDGSAYADSNSYASVAQADTYHADRGNTAWASATTSNKQIALIKATDYLERHYRGRYKGKKKTDTQALSWPRFAVYLDGTGAEYVVPGVGTSIDGSLIPDNVVPKEVIYACAEAALRALSYSDLQPDVEVGAQGVSSETVGPISVSYSGDFNPDRKYPAVEQAIAPVLNSAVFSINLARG